MKRKRMEGDSMAIVDDWLLPSEAGPEDGLLLWAFGRTSNKDQPFEIKERPGRRVCATRGSLYLEILDHADSNSNGALIFTAHTDDTFSLEPADARPASKTFASVVARIICQEEEYLIELRAMARVVRSLHANPC